MEFRVTDTRVMAEGISAIHPSALLAPLRQFMADQLRTQGAGGHPLLALRRRLVWIDAWEAERMARSGTSVEVLETWRRQAAHWRGDARVVAGVTKRWALQIQSHDGHWRSLAPIGSTGEVWIDITTDLAPVVRSAWEAGARILHHIWMLDQLGKWVAEPDPADRFIPTVVRNIEIQRVERLVLTGNLLG